MKNDLITPPLDVMPDIPIGYPHPGCFGFKRSHDIHTGVDLYAPYGTPVKAMEDGIIVKIAWFTGEVIGMPWWENTRAVYIEGKTGVFCYGEIMEDSSFQEGEIIKQGTYFGYRDFDEEDSPANMVIISHDLAIKAFLMRWYHWEVEEFDRLDTPDNCDIIQMDLQENNRYKLITELKRNPDL